jgi:hypothetical protein
MLGKTPKSKIGGTETKHKRCFMENKEYASRGVAGTALGIGIGALGLSALNGGLGNLLGGWNGHNGYVQSTEGKIGQLESEIAYLQAENYADKVSSEVYRALDNKIEANLEKLYGFVIDLDKRTALNAQGLHYENIITNNKIDCCCDKMNIQFAYENKLRDLADASIISYVNATFLPGTLKLPITSICPQPATTTTTA